MLKIKHLTVLLLIFTFIVSLPLTTYASETNTNNNLSDNTDYWPSGPDISSAAGIIMDASTGTVLYSKNINEMHYPASITKLMTVLLVLENCNLSDIVTFSHDAVFNIEPGSSHIGINEGEQLTIEQCLYGILLASANEVSNAVGEHIASGDINKFVDMMNQRASELGCVNTHFCNPHGLHDDNHYTCAYDMALITKELLKYDTFRIISGSKTYVIPPTNIQPESRYLNNTHKMLINSKYTYEGVEGGKTGFTNQALNTLVTYAKRDNLELIVVTLYGNQTHYPDTTALLDFAFDNFKSINISQNETKFSSPSNSIYKPSNGFFNYNDSLLTIDDSASIVLPKQAEFKDAKASMNIDKTNSDIYNLTYEYNNTIVGYTKLNLTKQDNNYFNFSKDNKNQSSNSTTNIVILIIILILIVLFLISFRNNLIKKGKNSKLTYNRKNFK